MLCTTMPVAVLADHSFKANVPSVVAQVGKAQAAMGCHASLKKAAMP